MACFWETFKGRIEDLANEDTPLSVLLAERASYFAAKAEAEAFDLESRLRREYERERQDGGR